MNEKSAISGMLKDALVLLVITIIAGAALGFIYQITKNPIARQEALAKENACKEVFQTAASFQEKTDATIEFANDFLAAEGYEAQLLSDIPMEAYDENGNLLGYVINIITTEGYGGNIQFAMGITLEGTLNGISILDIAETPGLGMKAEEVLVPQFAKKDVSEFEYVKSSATGDNQIQAISGATITTEAVTNGVNAGMYYFQSVLLKRGGSVNE